MNLPIVHDFKIKIKLLSYTSRQPIILIENAKAIFRDLNDFLKTLILKII
jgi:hypothetical protein